MSEIKYRFQDGDQAICTATIQQLNSMGIACMEDKFSGQIVTLKRFLSISEPCYKMFVGPYWYMIPESHLRPLPELAILQFTHLN